MADRKTGPVRPPMLEGEARPHDGPPEETRHDASPAAEAPAGPIDTEHSDDLARTSEPDEALPGEDQPHAPHSEPGAEDATTEAPHSAAPAPPLRPHRTGRGGTTALALAVAGGALGGVLLAFLLAVLGFWPTSDAGGNAESVAALQERISTLESRPAMSDGDALADLEARLAALESGQGDSGAIEEVAARADAADGAVTALAERVDSLSGQIEAMAAATGDGEGDAGAALAALDARLDEVADTTEQAGGATAALDERVAALEQALAEREELAQISAERDRLAQWPGALSALRGAVSAGEPFANELETVTDLAPELEIPQDLAQAAPSGIVGGATLIDRFAARIPDMLRATPADPEAGLFQSLIDQAGAAVALRPAGDVEGEGPQADLARAETALETGDFIAAQAAIARLPEAMRAAAGDLPALIDARANAEAFLATAESFAPSAPQSSAQQEPQEPQE